MSKVRLSGLLGKLFPDVGLFFSIIPIPVLTKGMTVLLRKALEVLLKELLRDDLISTVPYTIPIDGDELVLHITVTVWLPYAR